MANLIPPDAKRELKIQYWMRVATVWCWIVGVGALIAAGLLVPAFVLVQSQSNVYSREFDQAKEQTDAFTEARQSLLKLTLSPQSWQMKRVQYQFYR